MAANKVHDFLDKNKIKYVSISHSPAYTSQEVAASAHISGKQLAKIVIVKLDGEFVMVVVPAHDHVNFAALQEATHAKKIDLATEAEFKDKFPGCELGAMPPFGSLFGVPVYVSSRLGLLDNIAFNGGSHSELIQISYKDFERVVKPKIVAMQ